MRLILFVAVTALVGCRDVAGPNPIFEPHIALYAVLQPDSSLVRVVADELDAAGLRLPLSGAVGVVTGPNGSVTLAEDADSLPGCFVTIAGNPAPATPGCYVGHLPQPLASGETVTLGFALPSGGTVTGTVMIPGPPVGAIASGFERVVTDYQAESDQQPYPIARVPIDLISAPFASTVRASASVARAYYGTTTTYGSRNCASASSMTPFEAPSLQGQREFVLHDVICRIGIAYLGPWDSVDVSVHLMSVDANYAAYIREVIENTALDVDQAGFGIDGAVGVFGAVATSVLSFRVVYEGTPF